MADDQGSSVTLIFYKIGLWYREPLLNVLAAAAQMSHLTHVEIAIGESQERDGSMKNVARVFNDDELISRTGRSPHYSYLSLGCSKAAERAMLAYARRAVGKPFSGMAMARALLWPRQTDGQSFFCAELVAAILQEGGLLDRSSNAGGATPQSLYTLYVSRAASTANPYALSQIKQSMAQQSAQQHLLDSGLSASMASALAYGAPLPSANGVHAHAQPHVQSQPYQPAPPPPPQHVGGSFRPPCDRFAATGCVDAPLSGAQCGGGGGGTGAYPLLSAPQAQHLQTPPRPTPVLQNHRGAPSSACAHLANALAVAGAGAPPATATAVARRYHGRNESPPRQRFKPVGASSLAHVTMHAPAQHAHAHAQQQQQQQLALSLHSLNFAKPRGA